MTTEACYLYFIRSRWSGRVETPARALGLFGGFPIRPDFPAGGGDRARPRRATPQFDRLEHDYV
jgi:hypothetical protein